MCLATDLTEYLWQDRSLFVHQIFRVTLLTAAETWIQNQRGEVTQKRKQFLPVQKCSLNNEIQIQQSLTRMLTFL